MLAFQRTPSATCCASKSWKTKDTSHLVLLPGIVVAIARMVTDREEKYLTERFGEVYRQYRLRVRRWI